MIPFDQTALKLCSCYYERQFIKYNASAQLTESELKHTFSNAIIDLDNQDQFQEAISFVRNISDHLDSGSWLYIFGDEFRADLKSKEMSKSIEAFGTGKTYLMQCIANALCYRKIPALYITEEKLFGDIKSTYNKNSDESETEVLQRYYRVPVLMIDDLFTQSYTEWTEGKLFSILDERLRDKKITIITSNYAIGRIKERLKFGNGGKLASRIKGQATLIEMIGPDRR